MADNEKYCPLIKQVCIRERCEFFNEFLKRCQVSVLSYNVYRLAESQKAKSNKSSNQQTMVFKDKQEQGDSLNNGIPF
jgi:hypothetical protein